MLLGALLRQWSGVWRQVYSGTAGYLKSDVRDAVNPGHLYAIQHYISHNTVVALSRLKPLIGCHLTRESVPTERHKI
jgi:hypothetical protein